MVSASRIEGGGQAIPARLRKTIQSIKDVVGNHSDADIYAVLKESNLDPDETAQKLLNQDPFHEVKRKRDKRKENAVYSASIETRELPGQTRQIPRNQTLWDRNNVGNVGLPRSFSGGVNQRFRVVRDNRVIQNSNAYANPTSLRGPNSANEVFSNVSQKSSSVVFNDEKRLDARLSDQTELQVTSSHDIHQDHPKNSDLDGKHRDFLLEGRKLIAPKSELKVQPQKPQNSPPNTAASSNSSIGGLYSSSTDPVHVPPSDVRSGVVGAIKREVGVVGVRCQSTQNSAARLCNDTSTTMGKDMSASAESFRQSPPMGNSNQFGHSSIAQPVTSGSPDRTFLGNQNNNKSHQPPVAHQKVSQLNMEWKPKSNQKSIVVSTGINGIADTPNSASEKESSVSVSCEEVANLSQKLSQYHISEDERVTIPIHLRVSEAQRKQITFGGFEPGFDYAKGSMSGFQAIRKEENPKDEPAVSISLSVPVSSNEDASGSDDGELLEGRGGSGNTSTASDAASGHPMNDTKELSSPQNLDDYRSVGLFQSHSSSFRPDEPQQQEDPSSLPTFSAYDSQTYCGSFFRSALDENVRVEGIASPQEVLLPHPSISAPPSCVPMVQQQPVPQLYPQLHVSHYPNFMPYRQFISPVYVPPMAVPNYPNNPAYAHPSGSSYLLMQGGGSHLSTGGLKYAASQYKPVPAAAPSGYGNFNNAAGYTLSTPGAVGSAPLLEDTRIKYKEGNLYVPNPQADTSELWVQPPRELPSLQSTPFYNLSGQAPHGTFMPSHTVHASFNAPAQSARVQFPGLYHPPQPTAIANPHHLVHQQLPGMGGNVGVGVAAPGPQVGPYQQPQLGHLNWTTNF